MADRTRRQNDADHARQALARGDVAAATACCQRLLKRNHNDVDAMRTLAEIAASQGRYDEAISLLERCVKLRPRDTEARVLLGQTCFLVDDLDGAQAAVTRCLKYDPRSTEAARIKATIHDFRGEHDEAIATLDAAEAAGGRDQSLDSVRCMIALHRGDAARAVEIAEPILADERVDAALRRMVAYYKGQAHDALGDTDAAMAAWGLANELADLRFDAAGFVREVDEAIAFFTPERLAELPRAADRSARPVFIAGMPRSGTTLVEQVIDAHPDARGVGELRDVDRMLRDLSWHLESLAPYPKCLADASRQDLDTLGRSYLDRLDQLVGSDPQCVVNKSLKNFRTLGLVALILPGARVIHCRRDAIDTCLSIYMNPFNALTAPYAGDLEHLGLVHVQCDRLMTHWRSVLDLPFLEVSYETMVAEPEATIRGIIDFCGLPWDDRCLQFHASGRDVTTLSHHQVKKPIYRGSVGRYERYRSHLGPLIEALEAGTGTVFGR